MNIRKLIFLITILMMITSCSVVTPAPIQDNLQITVSVAPQVWLVKSLTNDLAEVQCMVNAGDNPHTYEPKPSQMEALAKTDLYFTIGVEFEDAWMPKLSNSNPKMRVVDVTQGVKFLQEEAHHAGEGAKPEPDPHIWFSAARMKILAKNTADALISFNPVNKSSYDKNLTALLEKIDQVDAEVKEKLNGIHRREFLIMHPLLAYFAEDYGLTQLPVEIDGQEPSPSELADLLDLAKKYQISALYVQRNTSLKMAETITKALGILEKYELEPLAEDWPANMLAVAGALAEGLK